MYVAHTGATASTCSTARRGRTRGRSPICPASPASSIDQEQRPALHERPGRGAGQRLSLLGRESARPGRGRRRIRTGSPTTARRRRLYAFNLGEPLGEDCTASRRRPRLACRSIAELPLPGRPRWAVYDPERDRVYANIREPAQIVVIDAASSGDRPARTSRAERRPARALARPRPALLRRRRRRARRPRPRQRRRCCARLPLPGVPDVVMHDPSGGVSTSRSASPASSAASTRERLEPLETIETERGRAHDSAGSPTAAACTSSAPQSGGAARLRGTRLSRTRAGSSPPRRRARSPTASARC